MQADEDYFLGAQAADGGGEGDGDGRGRDRGNSAHDSSLNPSRSNSEAGFYDANDRRGSAGSAMQSTNKSDNVQYVQLSNFAGLSSPTLASIAGKEGSVMSSLSSLSDHESIRKLSEDVDPPSLLGLEEESQREQRRKERRKKSSNAPPRVISTAEEFLLFQELFQPADLLFPTRMRVTTTLKDKQTTFKDNVRLVQEVRRHDGPVWTMKFSPNGLYLASGGQDGKIFVWCVASNTEMTAEIRNRSASREVGEEKSSASAASSASDSYAPVDDLQPRADDPASYVHSFVNPEPYRVYEGHSGDVIDLAWSKSCFILSASVDKTIRLWHVTRNDCLQYFRHPDIVTAVEFHPLHDRYFVSGCFDRKLRVWDIIPDGTVRMWVQATDTITAVAFSPDGSTVVGGLIQGQVYFFEYESLKHLTQMDCKNHAGRHKRGAKVTGIAYMPAKPHLQAPGSANSPGPVPAPGAGAKAAVVAPPSPATLAGPAGAFGPGAAVAGNTSSASFASTHMLVSTNDNRLRLCRLEDYSVSTKYKGLKNRTMQIKSQFSEDARFVIAGSDTGHVHIWRANVAQEEQLNGRLRFGGLFGGHAGRNTMTESFQNAPEPGVATTVGIFAPVDAVHSYLSAQVDYLDFVQQRPRSFGHGQLAQAQGVADAMQAQSDAAAAAAGQRARASLGRASVALGEGDLCSRVIAAADTDGAIRIYFRVNSPFP